jgi:tRNA (guanine10-N2)-methyltransferase
MPPLDLVRCDNAAPVWKVAGVLDAIVCDPPYGVRAGARKSGVRDDKVVKPISDEHRSTHIPGTVVCLFVSVCACARAL